MTTFSRVIGEVTAPEWKGDGHSHRKSHRRSHRRSHRHSNKHDC
jgi:hypothetical protein